MVTKTDRALTDLMGINSLNFHKSFKTAVIRLSILEKKKRKPKATQVESGRTGA